MAAEQWKGMSDWELVSALRVPGAQAPAGAAADELAERHYPWVLRLCLYEIADRSQAADCAQEVMIQLLRSLPKFDGRSELKTWMFAVAKRTIYRFRAVSKLRSLRFPLLERAPGEERGQDEERGVASDSLLVRSERNKKLMELIRKLPEQQRLAVLLHYFEDLPLAEAATRMGCSESTLKAHLYRARRRLGQWMKESTEVRALMAEEM